MDMLGVVQCTLFDYPSCPPVLLASFHIIHASHRFTFESGTLCSGPIYFFLSYFYYKLIHIERNEK
jgi:hypothetical protein